VISLGLTYAESLSYRNGRARIEISWGRVGRISISFYYRRDGAQSLKQTQSKVETAGGPVRLPESKAHMKEKAVTTLRARGRGEKRRGGPI